MISERYWTALNELGNTLQAATLDNNTALSTEEYLALVQVYESYGNPSSEDFQNSPELMQSMIRDLTTFHKILSGTRPQKQIIYIDFDNFAAFYQQNYFPRQHIDYADWQIQFLKAMEQHFTTDQGEVLNIEFVTKKPTHGKYTTLLLTDKEPYQALQQRSLEEKRLLINGMLHSSNSRVQSAAQTALQTAKNSLPKDASEDAVIALAFESDPIKNYTLNGTSAKNFEQGWGDLGNQHQEGLILLFGDIFLRGSIAPDKLAETAAHEVGHALGLEHPGGRTKTESSPDPRYPDYSLMDSMEKRVLAASGRRFHDAQMDYLKFVLGLKSGTDVHFTCAP